jgi:flagellar basal-body rod protein FlgC
MPSPVRFPFTARPLRRLMGPLDVSARGMAQQQKFMDVISRNIANAETTRTPDGSAYRREVASADGASVTTTQDAAAGRRVYDPGHPDADADGFVTYPNVDLNTELVDMMISRRVHEANATVFQAAKAMLKRALEI